MNGNEKLSFGLLGRFILRLLFCGLCAAVFYGILSLVGMPISQDIARIIGLVIGWTLYDRLFPPRVVAQKPAETQTNQEPNT